MEINLVKANKYITELKNNIHRYPSSYSGDCEYVIDENTDFDSKYIQENIDKTRNDLVIYENLYNDLTRLKHNLFMKNAEYGISDILHKMTLIGSSINRYKNIVEKKKYKKTHIITPIEDVDNVIKTVIESNKKLKEDQIKNQIQNMTSITKNISVQVFDIEEYTQKIKSLRKELNELENERDALNSKYTFVFEFSQESKDLLGL